MMAVKQIGIPTPLIITLSTVTQPTGVRSYNKNHDLLKNEQQFLVSVSMQYQVFFIVSDYQYKGI